MKSRNNVAIAVTFWKMPFYITF